MPSKIRIYKGMDDLKCIKQVQKQKNTPFLVGEVEQKVATLQPINLSFNKKALKAS
jgi:hypothetical protein